MAESEIALSADGESDDRAAVIDGLVAFNAEHGYPWPWRDLSLVLRDAPGSRVRGSAARGGGRCGTYYLSKRLDQAPMAAR